MERRRSQIYLSTAQRTELADADEDVKILEFLSFHIKYIQGWNKSFTIQRAWGVEEFRDRLIQAVAECMSRGGLGQIISAK